MIVSKLNRSEASVAPWEYCSCYQDALATGITKRSSAEEACEYVILCIIVKAYVIIIIISSGSQDEISGRGTVVQLLLNRQTLDMD
jgi:hypothetical protein